MLSQKPRHPIHSMQDSKPEWKAKPSSSSMQRDLYCGSRACPSGSNGPWLRDTREGSWSPPTAAALCTGKGNLALLEGYSLNVSASRIHAQEQVIVWFPHFPLCKQAGLVWLLSLKRLTLSTLTESWKKRDAIFFTGREIFLRPSRGPHISAKRLMLQADPSMLPPTIAVIPNCSHHCPK